MAVQPYQSDAAERPLFHKRLFWMLVLSILFHIGLVEWFRETHLANFAPYTPPRLIQREVFTLKNITIDPSKMENEEAAPPKPKPQPKEQKPLQVPEDKPDVTQGKMGPVVTAPKELVKQVVNDKPAVTPENLAAITSETDRAKKIMEEDLQHTSDLLNTPTAVRPSNIKVPDGTLKLDAARADEAGLAAASNRLDKMIDSGSVKPGDAPVTLPGGAVFEFGSSDLLPGATEQLRKLGMLIQKSPNITFSIEGYTDSFGDEAYNKQLSQQRAESVRDWLIQNMDVNPAHIQATGFGATNFLIKPRPVDMHSQQSIDAEKLLEQPNRRVEIRFK